MSNTPTQNIPLDSIVTAVIEKFKSRAEFGQKKYGTNLDRTDLDVLAWIQHAQEEHMDAILYLEKLKTFYKKPQTSEKPLSNTSSSSSASIQSMMSRPNFDLHFGC